MVTLTRQVTILATLALTLTLTLTLILGHDPGHARAGTGRPSARGWFGDVRVVCGGVATGD